MGIGRSTMHRYADGERSPDVETVHAIERVLGVRLAHHLDYRSVFDAEPKAADPEAYARVAAALNADAGLSEESRRFLLTMYERERARSRP